LLRQPDKRDLIPQSGGLRKVRMRLPGRGKSGGARVIYLHLAHHEQLKRLRQAVRVIKQEFKL
jgi:hypothetical protein